MKPVDTRPLIDQLDEAFQRLRERDGVIRRFNLQYDRQVEVMRNALQLQEEAKASIRRREKFLREKAAAVIRKRHNVPTIPGFDSQREHSNRFRDSVRAKAHEVRLSAQAAIRRAEQGAPSITSETQS